MLVFVLASQLEQAEQATQGDDSMILEMRDEFSKRIGELNTKLNKTTKVKFPVTFYIFHLILK